MFNRIISSGLDVKMLYKKQTFPKIDRLEFTIQSCMSTEQNMRYADTEQAKKRPNAYMADIGFGFVSHPLSELFFP